MKLPFALICIVALSTAAARSESSVTVTIEPQSVARSLPSDFVGLSFGMKAMLPDADGHHFFSPTNKPLITLFKNIGIHHLRMGGTTVEAPPSTPIPDRAAIDDLFAFVDAAGVQKVIYSFRLLETNAALHYDATNAALARYISDKYRPRLDCFSIANEPDLHRVFRQDIEITNFASYLAKWRRFAAAITNAVPDAKFAGPDAGSANGPWTTNFARRLKDTGLISVITEHFYVGGAGRDVPAAKGIDDMLSPNWLRTNERLYEKVSKSALALGFPYRFTEANDHYSGGVKGASETFAGALWALDFLHWWAAHGASGVNFHNTQWVVNDIITLDSDHEPAPNPKAYGLKAFELGSHGSPELITTQNSADVNLTAYAFRDTNGHFVTLINKEHGPTAREAVVTIVPPGKTGHAEAIFLTAPGNDAAAKTGVTLGGDSISNNKLWNGEWKPISLDESGKCTVKVPPASATIVKVASP